MDEHLYTIGGSTWINLANTLLFGERHGRDLLDGPEAADRWLAANGLGGAPGTAAADGEPLETLLRLRGLCASLLRDIVSEGRPGEATVSRLREEAASLTVGVCLSESDGGFTIAYEGRTPEERLRHAVLRSIADTAGLAAQGRIRSCEHEACVLHFADTSKSGKRRWCSMETCGNRRKAAEFYAKKKRQGGVTS